MEPAPMDVRVDRGVCRGSGACIRRAPATFSLDAQGKAVVAAEPGDPDPVIREAARSCPVFAITVGSARARGDADNH